MATFSTDKRKELSQKGQAMPDGGYPIRNSADLQNAIQAFGRANNKPEVKAWIKKRAKELNLENMLPTSWTSMNQSGLWISDPSNELQHHGIMGMHWGHRRDSIKATGSPKSKQTSVKEDPKKMSDDELRKRVNRLQMEQQYKSLSSSDIGKGKAFAQKFMKSATTAAAVTTTALTLYKNAGKIKEILGKIQK